MQTATKIGLDIAKSVFQVHGIDAEGNAIVRRQLKRLRGGILPEAAAVSGRYRRLRLIALLVARAPGARPYSALDARHSLP
jgi:hypothetical protein